MDILNFLETPDELLAYMNKNITYGFVLKNGKNCSNMFSKEWNDWYDQCIVQNGEEVLESKIGTFYLKTI